MNKILAFIVDENNNFLLLKGSPTDSQLKKSIWYTVTGGFEKEDSNFADTVIREIKEETGLKTICKINYLNWILKYDSLGTNCTEYVHIAFVKNSPITLNEESIDYKWCSLDEFVEEIYWFSDKKNLKNVLEKSLKKELYFKYEFIEYIK